MKYIALLRGINIGGRNIILKDDLRDCFESLGCQGVRTYIQSGNVLFRSKMTDPEALTAVIEKGLSARFAYEATVALLSMDQYQAAVLSAPVEWGKIAARNHYAAFTLDCICPQKVLESLPAPKRRIEQVSAGRYALFWSVSKTMQSKATISKLAAAPMYQKLTMRTHNTVYKLLDLFDEI